MTEPVFFRGTEVIPDDDPRRKDGKVLWSQLLSRNRPYKYQTELPSDKKEQTMEEAIASQELYNLAAKIKSLVSAKREEMRILEREVRLLEEQRIEVQTIFDVLEERK